MILRLKFYTQENDQKKSEDRYSQVFPSDSAVKNPPAMQETQVQSQGQEDPLEKKRASQSSIPAWEYPWTEEPCRLQYGAARVRHNLMTKPLPDILKQTRPWGLPTTHYGKKKKKKNC